jgi:hypothetical protein
MYKYYVGGKLIKTVTGHDIRSITVPFAGDGTFAIVSYLTNGEVVEHTYLVQPGCVVQSAWIVLHKVIKGHPLR